VSARLVTLAVALTLLLVGDAFAQSPPTFGGGRLQTAALPGSYEPTVGISLQPRDGQIAVRFDTSVRCGKEAFEVSGRKTVPFSGGTFSLDGASVKTVAKGRLVWTWSILGEIDGSVANGNLHISGARRISGRTRPCSAKPTRQFEARVAAPLTGAVQPRSRGLYTGTSTYEVVDRLQAPVVMRVSQDVRKVTSRWTIGAACRRGPRVLISNLTPPMRIGADGRFSRDERYSIRYLDSLIRYRAQFSGRFAGDGASGTLRLRARVFNRSGKRLRTRCDSGRRAWSTVLASLPG